MIPERWDPLIIYLDMGAIAIHDIDNQHRPLHDFQKSIAAFLDWAIGRYSQIDSILIGAYSSEPWDGEEYNLSEFRPIEQAFIDAIFWAIDNDPIYKHLSEKMRGKINIIPPDTLESINISPTLSCAIITPPDIILTGRVSNYWAEQNNRLLRRLTEPFILFDKYGTTEGLSELRGWTHDKIEVKQSHKISWDVINSFK